MSENTSNQVPPDQHVEKVFATKYNDGFAAKAQYLIPILQEWTDRPLSTINFIPDPNMYFGVKSINALSSSEFAKTTYGKGDSVILDFGSHRVGYLSFHLGVEGINIDAPARLRLTFGEVPFDVLETLHPCNSWISTSWIPDEVINVDWLPCEVSMPRRYAFRYLKIEVIDTSPKYKVKFEDVKVRAVSAISPRVLAKVELLSTKDEELKTLDRISMVTLQSCMQTVFEDGPRRDRRLWIGDLRLQALTNYCTFKDYNLVKRCLYLFAALPREDDSLPACLFEKPKLSPATDYIVDYDALFGSIVLAYAQASGDIETARELFPTVLGSIRMAASLVSENGKFAAANGPGWKFLDWSDGLDVDAGMHGLVLYCCKEVNSLATLLDEPVPYKDLVQKMTSAATSFFDESLGVYVSGPKKQVSWISQAWMAIASVSSAEIHLKALKIAMNDPTAVKPLTPYAYHHVAEALALCGGQEDCLVLMKEYWGGMARAGADTFWECYDSEDPRKSPYGDYHNNSYCHAWSCTPSYLIRVVLKEYLTKR